MLPAAVLAGLTLVLVPLDEEIRDVAVVDLDADGREDIVAVSAKATYLFRSGKGPALRRPAAPLVVVGHGLVGVVRDGAYRPVTDPFGAWSEGDPGVRSLLAGLGRAEAAILVSPGDLDGDGRDDPVLASREGFHTPAGLVPVKPEAALAIYTNEAFAVEFRIPAPRLGRWRDPGELVFFTREGVVAYRGIEESARVPLVLPTRGQDADSIRRNLVFLRDVDGNGKLDLLVVVAKGATGFFTSFEATARFWRDDRIYHEGKQGFYRPATFLKVAGALLRPTLLDLDSDGDLDLVLATVDTSIVAAATGTAPGTYHLFRFERRGFQRQPAWTFHGPVPMTVFTEKPEPPVRFLPDLDDDGRPEAIARGNGVVLLEANRQGRFRPVARADVPKPGRLATGLRFAAVAHGTGVVIVEGTP